MYRESIRTWILFVVYMFPASYKAILHLFLVLHISFGHSCAVLVEHTQMTLSFDIRQLFPCHAALFFEVFYSLLNICRVLVNEYLYRITSVMSTRLNDFCPVLLRTIHCFTYITLS